MILYRRARGVELIHCTVQVFLTLCLYLMCLHLIPSPARIKVVGGVDHYVLYALLIVLGLGFDCLRNTPGKQNLLNLDLPSNIYRSSRQVIMTMVVVMCFIIGLKDNSVSRLFFFGFIPVFFAGLLATNKYLPSVIATFVFRNRHKKRTLVVGSSESVSTLWTWLERKRSYGIEIIGILTDEMNPCVPVGCNVLGKSKELIEKIVATRAIQVFVLDTPSDFGEIRRLYEICENLGVRLMMVCNWSGLIGRKMDISGDDGIDLLSFYNDPLECPFNRTLKRMLDVTVSVPVVIMIIPFTSLLVWFLQRLQSPGPLFFRQVRRGMNGETFRIIKYRTMHSGNSNESRQATREDERVFSAGRWLRKFSIDELPQFINVLIGDMSIVGPRPHMVAHDDAFGSNTNGYLGRRFIKPGITGLAQVRGLRGETRTVSEISARVMTDLRYIEDWTLLLDALIIARTSIQILKPPSTSY